MVAPIRPYALTVLRTERLSPSFQRLVLTADSLATFGTERLDQRIKIMLPLPGGRWGDPEILDPAFDGGMDWYWRWRDLPEADQNVFRTYTVRDIDVAARELTVDFVVHPGAGPLGTYAETATVGDEVVVIGPDGRSDSYGGGIDFNPGDARRILLVGDETAVPAIASIVECLAARGGADEVHAILEVPHADDVLTLPRVPWLHADWAHREEGQSYGATLEPRLRAWTAGHPKFLADGRAEGEQTLEDVDVDKDLLWDSPEEVHDGAVYAWMAGEAAAIKILRRILVRESGMDKRRVAFMGYWRSGKAEGS